MEGRSAASRPRPGKRLREVVSTPTIPKRTIETQWRRQTFPIGIPTTHDLPLPGSVSSPVQGSISGISDTASQTSQPSQSPGAGDGSQSPSDAGNGSTPGSGESTPPTDSPSAGPSQPVTPPPSSQPPTSPSSTPSSNSASNSNSNSNSSPSSPSDSAPSTPSLPSSTPSESSSSPSIPTDAPTPTDVNAQASLSAQTTITSTIVTDINGVHTTIVTAIPTTLSNSSDPSGTSTQERRAIIAGASIAGVALVFIIISLIFFCRRRNHRKERVFGDAQDNPRSRSMLLAEEFDDTEDPMVALYRDHPASRSPYTPSSIGGPPTGSVDSHHPPHVGVPSAPVSPHIMGLRASESGSIFREAVWPPPGEASRMVDPMLVGSSQVDLTKIVDEVMGPSPTTSERELSPRLSSPPPAHSVGVATHLRGGSGGSGASGSQTSLAYAGISSSVSIPPRDPFKTPPAQPFPAYEPRYRNASSQSLSGALTPPHHTPSPSSDAAHLSPSSPSTPPRLGALYVTNGVVESPVASPRNWLDRTPKPGLGDGASTKRHSGTGSFFARVDAVDTGEVGRAV